MATVLFVDDDRRLLEYYVDAVGKLQGVNVHVIGDVDDALTYLRDPANSADVIVWDIMMPPGKTFRDKDTEGGLSTGRFLFPAMREIRGDAAYVLLTLREDSLDEFWAPEKRWHACSKLETTPEMLCTLVKDLLGGVR